MEYANIVGGAVKTIIVATPDVIETLAGDWVAADGAWIGAAYKNGVFSRAIPTSISMRQARLALLGAGMLAQVDAAIAAMPGVGGDAARIEWEYATSVERSAPLVAGLTGALSLTPEQLDALFVDGAAL